MSVVVGTSLLVACAPAKNPPALLSSADIPSSDIVIRRSSVASSTISTNSQSSGVDRDDDPAVISSLDAGNQSQQGFGANLSDAASL